MAAAGSTGLDRLDPREREWVESLPETERDVVLSTLVAYRRQPSVGPGSPVPDLELHLLDGGTTRLAELLDGRPLVLVFGSFT